MLDHTELEKIERSFSSTKKLWYAMIGSLIVYIAVCYAFPVKKSSGEYMQLLTVVFAVVSATELLIASFIRRAARSGSGVMFSNIKPKKDSNEHPVAFSYRTAVLIALALVDSIGIYGVILYFLGGGFDRLYAFVAVSAVAMIYLRPKKEKLYELVEKMNHMQTTRS